MKRKIMILLLFAGMMTLLIFPVTVSNGARNGLMLWFTVVFPALLPFMVLSGVIVRMQITSTIGRILYPLFHRLFRVSENGCYAAVVGLISGYPLGAKTAADLCRDRRITRSEGQYLVSFCNNASPMFLLEYMAVYCMGMKRPYLLLIIVYLSGWINALLFQKLFRCYQLEDSVVKYTKASKKANTWMEALDESILDAFVTLAKVGGYIILFSIMAQLTEDLLPLPVICKAVGLGAIEITTGGDYLRNGIASPFLLWVLGAAVSAFGGFSSIAQTSGVLQGSGISVRHYILAKAGHALIAAGMAGAAYVFWG